jgi:hypothetical protein
MVCGQRGHGIQVVRRYGDGNDSVHPDFTRVRQGAGQLFRRQVIQMTVGFEQGVFEAGNLASVFFAGHGDIVYTLVRFG